MKTRKNIAIKKISILFTGHSWRCKFFTALALYIFYSAGVVHFLQRWRCKFLQRWRFNFLQRWRCKSQS
jgi:hypothetical protein